MNQQQTALQIIGELDAEEIQQRLREIDRESQALRVLLRAARRRERVSPRECQGEESERVYQEALEFCEGPAGMIPAPDCEKAIEIIRKLLAGRRGIKTE